MSTILKKSLKVSAICFLTALSGKAFAMDPTGEYQRRAAAYASCAQPQAVPVAASLQDPDGPGFFPEMMRAPSTSTSAASASHFSHQPPSYKETELSGRLIATQRELSMTQSTLMTTQQAFSTLRAQTEALLQDAQQRVTILTQELEKARMQNGITDLQCQLKDRELHKANARTEKKSAQLEDILTRYKRLGEEFLGERLTLTHENAALRRALRNEREESSATIGRLLEVIEVLQVAEPRAAAAPAAAAPRVDVAATVRRARVAVAAPAPDVVVAPNRLMRGARFTEDAANRGAILIMKASQTAPCRAFTGNPAAARANGAARTALIKLIKENPDVRRVYPGITDEEVDTLIEGGIRGIEMETLSRPAPGAAAEAAA